MSSFADVSEGNGGTGVSPVRRLLVRRTAVMLPTLVGVSLLLCAIAHFTPGSGGGSAAEGANPMLSAEQRAAVSAWQAERFGDGEPFFVRYGMWMQRVFTRDAGDVLPLGASAMTGRTVRAELVERLPVTVALSGYALLLALLAALPAGLMMALKAGGAIDRGIFGVMLTLWSVPMVVMASLLLACATRGGVGVPIFPGPGVDGEGGVLEALWRLTPAALCLAIVACAPLARQVRAALLEQLGQEYVQTALAKGLSRPAVIRRHVVRAGLGPIVTVLALLVPTLIAGSVLVETVFGIDGMGRLAWRSAVNRDLDVVLMIALLTAVAHQVSLLGADVLYMVIDPRVRIGGGV